MRALRYLLTFTALSFAGLLVGIGVLTYEEWLKLQDDGR